MAYNRVHERVGKEIPKNIQDYIWRREEWGQIYDVTKYNITQITNMKIKNREDKWYLCLLFGTRRSTVRGKNISQNFGLLEEEMK